MSTTVNTGWLKNSNGDKFAPKTLTSQVINNEGVSIDQLLSNLPSADGSTEVTQASIIEALGYTPANESSLGNLAQKDSVEQSDLSSDVQTSLGKADTALQSYTETDPTVPSWAKASTKPSYTKSEVGLGNVDNVKQYSASNPPPYPVTSINGETGAVTLDAAGVGARPSTWTPSASDVGAVPTSRTVNGKALSANISLTASDVGARASTWMPTAANVGADPAGTASSAVDAHNTDGEAHADIRNELSQFSTQIGELSEEIANLELGGNEGTLAGIQSVLTDIVTFLKAVPFDDTVASASDLDDIQSKIDALGSGGGNTEEPEQPDEPDETISATFSDGVLAISGMTANSATFNDGVLAVV